jgi:hypothetical protein
MGPQELEPTHFLALCGTAEQAAEKVANERERRPSAAKAALNLRG